MTPAQHTLALDYLAIHLSIRDREQITQVLCHSQPDHVTQAIRDLVAAYEPMIRSVHNAVDLGDTLYDFELFLRDMIKLGHLDHGRAKDAAQPPPPPTVGDFVQLLKKHQGSSHKFLHQCAKNGKDVTRWFHEYARQSAMHFRRSDPSPTSPEPPEKTRGRDAGDLSQPLQELYASLDAQTRKPLPAILDAYATYLSKLHAASAARLHAVVTSPPSANPVLASAAAASSNSVPVSRTASPAPSASSRSSSLRRPIHKPNSKMKQADADDERSGEVKEDRDKGKGNPGPGAYLARWQNLLDGTRITPAEAEGARVRGGIDGSVVRASAAGPDAGLEEDGPAVGDCGGGGGEDGEGGVSSGKNEDKVGEEEDVFHEARERLDELGLPDDDKVAPPDVAPVARAMLPKFRELLASRG